MIVKQLKGLGYKPYKEIYLPIHMGEPDPCIVYRKPYKEVDLCIMVNTRERVCDYMVYRYSKNFFTNKNIHSLEEARSVNVVGAWMQLMKDLEELKDEIQKETCCD